MPEYCRSSFEKTHTGIVISVGKQLNQTSGLLLTDGRKRYRSLMTALLSKQFLSGSNRLEVYRSLGINLELQEWPLHLAMESATTIFMLVVHESTAPNEEKDQRLTAKDIWQGSSRASFLFLSFTLLNPIVRIDSSFSALLDQVIARGCRCHCKPGTQGHPSPPFPLDGQVTKRGHCGSSWRSSCQGGRRLP